MARPPALLSDDPRAPFPPVEQALREPDGLLAVGGDLSPVRLLNAYAQGIFPWFSHGQPILWWSPDPRVTFDTGSFRLPSRFRRQLRQSEWTVRADTAFDEVVSQCAHAPRPGQDGTWIVPAMRRAYGELHRLGHAHSVEVYEGEALVGGIYGVGIGRMFFGESMFSGRSGGSKVALAALAGFLHEQGCPMIDAQVENSHLLSLGARLTPRSAFMGQVRALVAEPALEGSWAARFGVRTAAGL